MIINLTWYIMACMIFVCIPQAMYAAAALPRKTFFFFVCAFVVVVFLCVAPPVLITLQLAERLAFVQAGGVRVPLCSRDPDTRSDFLAGRRVNDIYCCGGDCGQTIYFWSLPCDIIMYASSTAKSFSCLMFVGETRVEKCGGFGFGGLVLVL